MMADKLIRNFGFDVDDFPEAKKLISKKSLKYYLDNCLSKTPCRGQVDPPSLPKIVDMLTGYT